MKNVHVVPRGKAWAVRTAGADRVAMVTPRQSDAIARGRDMAIRQQSELVRERSVPASGLKPTRPASK